MNIRTRNLLPTSAALTLFTTLTTAAVADELSKLLTSPRSLDRSIAHLGKDNETAHALRSKKSMPADW
jgi:hypothetical protein